MSDASGWLLRRWRHFAAAAAVLAIAGLLAAGSDRRPCPPAHGKDLGGRPVSSPVAGPLRVGTFNIHSGRNAEGQFDLGRTARCLEGLHLAGLNEVRGAWQWQAGDQAELLGRQLGMGWLFAPAEQRWWRDDFGNALLTCLPVVSWRREPLPCTQGKAHRNLVIAELEHGGRRIYLLVTHLDRVRDRQAQLELVIDRFLALPEPALLMGDLNTRADDPRLAGLLNAPGVHDCIAEGRRPADSLPPRIDWILARGLRTRAAGLVENNASDHPFAWAELEIPGPELATGDSSLVPRQGQEEGSSESAGTR
jgi:endonuclease/exonuclease/phosphatase family metal-dependent hydrolase